MSRGQMPMALVRAGHFGQRLGTHVGSDASSRWRCQADAEPLGETGWRKGGARCWKLLAGCGSEGTDLAWPGRAGPRTGAGGDRARHLQKSDGGASRLRGVCASCEASPDLSVPGGAADRADSRVAERRGRRPFRAPSRARTRAHQSAPGQPSLPGGWRGNEAPLGPQQPTLPPLVPGRAGPLRRAQPDESQWQPLGVGARLRCTKKACRAA